MSTVRPQTDSSAAFVSGLEASKARLFFGGWRRRRALEMNPPQGALFFL
jgi:hypothetical protein